MHNKLMEAEYRSLETYGRILRRILDVEQKLEPYQMKEILKAYQEIAICDKRMFHFQVSARTNGKSVELSGEVSLRELKTGLIALLKSGGIESVVDRIQILPSEELQGQVLALVQQPSVAMFRDPTPKSEQVSQLLIGDAVEILKKHQSYCLIQGPDGYLGWTQQSGLCPCDPQFFNKWLSLPRAAFLESVKTKEIDIPLGAELPLLERGRVLLPGGQEHQVQEKTYRPLRWLKQPQRQTVVAMAKRFKGVPYLWGGKSTDGIDCSGLVQAAYRAAGIYLSRDANQQFLAGRIVATRNYRGEIAPGDLLFFTSAVGNISHIAISLGEGKFIHSGEKGVAINSLNPEDSEYDANRARSFVYAKRLIQ